MQVMLTLKALDKASAPLKAVAKAVKALSKGAVVSNAGLNTQFKGMAQGANKTGLAFTQLSTKASASFGTMQKASVNAGQAFTSLSSKATTSLGAVQKHLSKTGVESEKSVKKIHKLAEVQNHFTEMSKRGKEGLLEGAFKAFGSEAPIMKTVKDYHEFEDILNDVGIKGDLAGEKLMQLGGRMRALSPQVNLSALELVKGLDVLTGFGMANADAEQIMKPLAIAAAGSKATMEDLSRSAFSAIDNLKVPLDEIPKMLDIMHQAGKEGAFELKDMAQYFSKLTAGAYQLGFKGTKGIASMSAALQVARKGAGDAAEAANNMENFFQKINAANARKAFKAVGVDITKVTAQAKKAEDPMAVYMEAIGKIVKLDPKTGNFDLSKLTDLFGDMQVDNFLKPMLQNMKEYKRIREATLKADGAMQTDFERRMALGVEKTKAMGVALSGLSLTLGQLFAPMVNKAMDKVTALISQFHEFTLNNSELVGGIVSVIAVLGSLGLVFSLFRMVFGFIGGGLAVMARAFLFLLSPIRLVAQAMILAHRNYAS